VEELVAYAAKSRKDREVVMGTVTVRMSEESRTLLRELAEQANTTQAAVVEKALSEYRKKLFWERATADFVAVRADEQAWTAEKEEQDTWDGTLADGLEDEGGR
jgi:predicted transcriptional regulator